MYWLIDMDIDMDIDIDCQNAHCSFLHIAYKNYKGYTSHTIIKKIKKLLETTSNSQTNESTIKKLYRIFCEIICIDEHHDAIELLLFGNNKSICPSYMDNLAIKRASEFGCIKNVKLLLQHPDTDPSADGNASITHATRNGHTQIVKILMQDKRVYKSHDMYKKTFETACRYGYHDIVELLISEEDDIYVQDYYVSLLEIASINGSIEIVKLFLLSNKYYIKYLDDCKMVFFNAAYYGHLNIVQFLLNEYEIHECMETDFTNYVASYEAIDKTIYDNEITNDIDDRFGYGIDDEFSYHEFSNDESIRDESSNDESIDDESIRNESSNDESIDDESIGDKDGKILSVINGKIHPSIDQNYAMMMAAQQGKISIVKYLLTQSATKNTNFIRIVKDALKKKYFDIVQLFVQKINLNKIKLGKIISPVRKEFLSIIEDEKCQILQTLYSYRITLKNTILITDIVDKLILILIQINGWSNILSYKIQHTTNVDVF